MRENEKLKPDCSDFGKFIVEDTNKCAYWDKEKKEYVYCPIMTACAMRAGIHYNS